MARITFLGADETAIRLGIKTRFADIRLNPSDSIMRLLSLFKCIYIEHLLYVRTNLGTDDTTVTKRMKYTHFHGVNILLGMEDPDISR